jgi:hypothetical protein
LKSFEAVEAPHLPDDTALVLKTGEPALRALEACRHPATGRPHC